MPNRYFEWYLYEGLAIADHMGPSLVSPGDRTADGQVKSHTSRGTVRLAGSLAKGSHDGASTDQRPVSQQRLKLVGSSLGLGSGSQGS